MKKILVFAAMGLFGAAQAFAAEAPWQDFSADMVTTSEGQVIQARVYFAKDRTRMEMGPSTVITRLDRNVSWIVMPAENMYMEQPIDPAMFAKMSKEVPGEVERVPMGKESVNGVEAEKFKITYKEGADSLVAYQYLAEGGTLPVRVESADGAWLVDYKNIQRGPQPESLFEEPSGYQKMSMPSVGNLGALGQSYRDAYGDE